MWNDCNIFDTDTEYSRILLNIICWPLIPPLQFPSLLNGHVPLPLPSVDSPSPLQLSYISHQSWYQLELGEWIGPHPTLAVKHQPEMHFPHWWHTSFTWKLFSLTRVLVLDMSLCAVCTRHFFFHAKTFTRGQTSSVCLISLYLVWTSVIQTGCNWTS